MCAERRTDERDRVSICTVLFTPPPLSPNESLPGSWFSCSALRVHTKARLARHIIGLARGLMGCGPSARTGSVGDSLPPWSRRSSSSAWSLWEPRKPLLLLDLFQAPSPGLSPQIWLALSVVVLAAVSSGILSAAVCSGIRGLEEGLANKAPACRGARPGGTPGFVDLFVPGTCRGIPGCPNPFLSAAGGVERD